MMESLIKLRKRLYYQQQKILHTVLEEKATKELDNCSLSNNSVTRRINIMVSNIKNIMITQLKICSNCSLRVDGEHRYTKYGTATFAMIFTIKEMRSIYFVNHLS